MGRFLVSFAAAIPLGLAVAALVVVYAPVTALEQWRGSVVSVPEPSLIYNAQQVDRTGWQQFRTTSYGFELYFPDTFSMVEKEGLLELRPLFGDYPIITFRKLRERIVDATEGVEYQMGSYKVQDRQNLVLTSPYFSDAADVIESSYLFVRDFQLSGGNAPVVIMKADIRESSQNPVFALAKANKIADIESVLTEAQQILSTFRFLSYQEIYGPEGFQGDSSH